MIKKASLYFCVVILCGGSLLCSVALWAGEQSTLFLSVLFGSFAAALEVCKFIFFPLAKDLFGHSKLPGMALYFAAFVLFVASIFATVSFLETSAQQSDSDALKSSHAYLSSLKTVQSLEAQIDAVQANMEKDSQFNYRSRAAKQSKQLEALQKLKADAVNKLQSIKVKPISGTQSIFEKFGERANSRLYGFLFWAVAVDVCGIICLMLLSSERQPATSRATSSDKVSSTDKSLREKLIDQDYSARPVISDIARREDKSPEFVKAVFKELMEGGLMEYKNKRYVMVNA